MYKENIILKPLSTISEGPPKINNECRKTTVAGKLLIWAMYSDQRQ
jgi:hypothetical protein